MGFGRKLANMSELKHKRFADGMKYLVKKKWNNDTSMIHEWDFPASEPRSLILFILLSIKSLSRYFLTQNETLRLFSQKTFSRKKESFCPYRATGLHPSLPRVLPWAKSFCPFRACGAYICKHLSFRSHKRRCGWTSSKRYLRCNQRKQSRRCASYTSRR